MLLQLIKNHRKSSFFLFPVVLTGIWIKHLLAPYAYTPVAGEDRLALFGLFNGLVPAHLLTRSLIALVLLALNGLLLFRIYREHLFPKSWSMLPAILFVMITSGIAGYQTMHPVWLALPFMALAIDRLFASFDQRKPYGSLFNAGIFLSLGSLFWFHLIFMLPAFLIGSHMMARDSGWRDGSHMFLGALVPWIFAFAITFLTDSAGNLATLILSQVIHPLPPFTATLPVLIFAGLMAVLTLAGSYAILRDYDHNKVSFRRFYVFFFLLFLSCVAVYFLVPAVNSSIFILAALPVTFLLSNYFESLKRVIPGEVIFTLILALVVYIQLL
jgi:hypothetical protein